MALFNRGRTGVGDVVDVALYEPLMFIIGDIILQWTGNGVIQERVGNGTGSASPRGIFQAKDGKWLSIAASSQTIAVRLFEAMDRPDIIKDPRYATNAARMEHNEDMQKIVSEWVQTQPRTDILAILESHDVVAAGVNDARDVTEDPNFSERTLVDLTGSDLLGRSKCPARSCMCPRIRVPSMREFRKLASTLKKSYRISWDLTMPEYSPWRRAV